MKKHTIGTVVVFSNADALYDITNGKEYIIAGVDADGDEYFYDDANEMDFAASTGGSDGLPGDGIYTVIKEG